VKQRFLFTFGLTIAALGLVAGLVLALSESEPNDTPAQANSLSGAQPISGAVDPAGDVDYFAQDGVNVTWGYIALLETVSSTTSQQGTLTALGNDGTTVLQSDTGSWEHGSGIALQNYADSRVTHYLRVNEDGDDATVSTYTLRYYNTIVRTQPEAEPNETRSTGTPSAFTHEGTLSTSGDVDCFAFQGRADDTILLALNGDPEADGSPADPVLELVDASDTVLKTVDFSGAAGKEFLEYPALPSDGVYAYCVRVGAGSAGAADATYKVGLVRNGGLYVPDYEQGPTWLNPRPGHVAYISDTLSFRLAMTNTSPITIPGDIDFRATYSSTCLSFLDASLAPTSVSPGTIEWDGLKPSGLVPGEVYSVTANFQALNRCGGEDLHQSTGIDYFFTGSGGDAAYNIHTPVFLPVVQRQ
jgi:hypothetical protein